MNNDHFPDRKLILPESTEEMLSSLSVQDAPDDAKLLPTLPSSFSIRNEMTPVKDQGQQGSCTSFCVAACLEHIHRQILSEGSMQHEAEKAYGDCKEGLAVVHSFEISKVKGAVLNSVWPYDDGQVCWNNPPNTSGKKRYKFNNYGRVYQRSRLKVESSYKELPKFAPGLPLTLAIQRQLFGRRRPVAISVPVVRSAWPWDGNITMPPTSLWEAFFSKASLPNVAGWHCITICGWNNSTGRFIFKNSWGPFWGNKGYGTIPYQYVDGYSDLGIVAL